jgi:cytokinin riboside 5'-monophosphate phosphoribohydrolase
MTATGGGRTVSICVFCGSAESPPQVFVDAARQLGQEIGRRGHRLVYGGTPVGLMGVVARAVHDTGGSVVGVVPRGLFDHLIIEGSAGELVVTDTLGERKAEMVARADAFVVLPGGYGTLEELVEVLALRHLGLHRRPIVLLNVGNFWQPLLQQARQMVMLGFAHASEGVLFRVVDLASRAMELLEEEVAGALPVADGATIGRGIGPRSSSAAKTITPTPQHPGLSTASAPPRRSAATRSPASAARAAATASPPTSTCPDGWPGAAAPGRSRP